MQGGGGCASPSWTDLGSLYQTGLRADKNGLTRAGYEYQKHMDRGELPPVSGTELNAAGADLLWQILTSSVAVTQSVTSGNFAGGMRFIIPGGPGATFDQCGNFQYFGQYP
jgi:hypothetical protein